MFVNEEAGQGSCQGGSDTRQMDPDQLLAWARVWTQWGEELPEGSPSDAGRKEFERAGTEGKRFLLVCGRCLISVGLNSPPEKQGQCYLLTVRNKLAPCLAPSRAGR